MVWNLIKLAFQRNQQHFIWIFQDGVIAKTLKTAQKTNSHAETTQKLISWKLVHIAYPFFSFLCLYLSRRAVPSINIHVLLSKRNTFDNQNTEPPFVQLCANKYWEWSLPLCSCDFLRGIYRSGGFIRSQLVLLLPSRFALIDCRLCWLVLWECGWANPRFRLPVKDGGWLWVLFARLH